MKQSKKMKRDVKRRLMLTKRNNFSSSAVKTLNMNKRVTAFFVAFAMILSMLPMGIFLHTRAGEMDQLDPVAMLVRMNGVDNWDEVTVDAGKISDNIGKVQVDNMPDGAEFVKAVMIDHDTGIETEIQSLGAIGDDYYYSLNDDTNVGTLLDKTHEELILIYGNRYRITVQQSGEGAGTYEVVAHEDDAGKYVWAKEDIVIKAIEPGMDCKIDGIQYRSGTSNGTASIKNGIATVPYNKIKGDVTLTLDFEQITSYSITEGDVAQGDICQNMNSSSTKTDRQNVDPVTPGNTATFLVFSQSWTGDDVWVLNQLTLNGEDLNLPSTEGIKAMNNGTTNTNGIDGYSATTTLDNGSEVTVKLIAKGVSLPWKKDDVRGLTGYLDKKRCVYEVTITNVHEDYVVDGNFKEADSREVIIKGLRGIEKTGAAKEELYTGTGNSWDVAPRYYTLVQNDDNIYTANYTNFLFSEGTYPSDNLILYTVKTGYNPYSVTTKMKYGNTGEAVNVRAVSVDGTEAIPGKPVDVIRNASVADGTDYTTGRFDTSFRHWGYNSPQVLENNDTTYSPGILFGNSILGTNKNLLLTDVHEDTENDWYAVALPQNAAMDQQLFLNASPYEFKLQLNAQGNLGSSASVNFANSENRFAGEVSALRETESHSVVSANPYGTLPKDEPTSTGYAFEYWVLTDDAGNILELPNSGEMQYQPLDRINLTEELIDAVVAVNDETDSDKLSNEKTIYLSAVWKEVQESSKTKVEINAYHQSASGTEAGNGKTYARHYGPVQETQNVGSVALLNLHQPDRAEYYVLNADLSVLKTDAKKQTSSDVIPDDNYLNVYYDYKTVTLDLQKVVKGKPKSTEYTITLTLTKPADSPVSVEEALAMLNLSTTSEGVTTTDSTITITRKYGKNSKISFENVPYNWSYHVLEDVTTDANDYTSTDYDQTGYLTDNTKLIVTNTGNNPGIETDKKLTDNGDGTYDIDLAAYATGESYTEQLDSNVPLDIAIVLDQSGSMATSDVYKYDFVDEGNKHQTAWTVNEATGKYVKVGTNYYPVESYSTEAYQLLYQRGDWLPYELTTGFSLFTDYNNTKYYIQDNNKLYNLQVKTKGYTLWGSGHDDGRGYWAGYHLWMRYKNANGDYVIIKDYNGYEENDYKASTIVTEFETHYRLGKDIYKKTTVYGLRYKNAAGKYVYLSKPSLTSVSADDNTVTYIADDTSVYNTSTDVTFVDSMGRVNDNGQTLFTRTPITRVQALRNAVNSFVGEVANQAKEHNVDHRVAIIGYASNETPGTSSGTYNPGIGYNDKWDYVNTGLFYNDGNGIVFENYETITGFQPIATRNMASNWHYFIQSGSTYIPVYYSNGRWYRYDNNNQSTGPFYQAIYDNKITDSDYQKALVSASNTEAGQFNGVVNSDLTDSIAMVKAYGGTYTSIGMSMANQLFEANPIEEGSKRKRIILVFSDGEPGRNGFDTDVANEALVESAFSKNEYGASVYTVGLYPSGISADAEGFMKDLSSQSFASTNYTSGPELEKKTYYYQYHGRVKSVTTSDTAKAWHYFDNEGYIRTADMSNYYFRDSDGNVIDDSDIDESKPYYIQLSESDSTLYPIDYGYVWYDSEGYPVLPTNNIEDERVYRYHFFEIADTTEADDSTRYYFESTDSFDLKDAFETISSQLQHPTTTVKLDAYSSFMKDGISDNFDYSKASVTLRTYDADNSIFEQPVTVERVKNDFQLSNTSADGATVDWDKESTNYLTVNGFDYSKYYIGEDHDGKILVATISGLKLKEGVHGAQIASNTTDSGVYKKDGDTSKMVAEFPQQYTSAGTYSAKVTLNYVGNRKIEGQKFNVELKLTKSDSSHNEPYSGNFGGITFNSNGVFSTKMADGTSKEISGIPKDAVLTVTVSDPDNANTYYTYLITDTINNGDQDITTTLSGEDPRIGSISIEEDHPNILISVTDNRQPFTVTNHTQGQPGESDFSDKTKKFPITLTLYKNGETEPVSGEVSLIDQSGENILFKNGEYTAELADNETLALFAPEGYTIKVEDKGTFNYSATYQMDADTEDSTPRTAVFNEASRENGHAVNVYHTVDSVVISGILDKAGKVNPFIWAAIGVALAGVIWLMIMNKRKRKNGEM